jgi:hypothetical protein
MSDVAPVQAPPFSKPRETPWRSTKPSATVYHPPAKDEQRQGERQVPPERWQEETHEHTQNGEQQPEDFLFHLEKPYH